MTFLQMHVYWVAALLFLWCRLIQEGSSAVVDGESEDSCAALSLPEPVPFGIDLEVDAAVRRIYEGRFSQPPSVLDPAYLRAKYQKIAPIYLYERTCGEDLPARQVVIRVGEWLVKEALEDGAQEELLNYYRWVVEAYWEKLVPAYRVEPKLFLVVDFTGVGWGVVLQHSLRIQSLIIKASVLLRCMKGKSWSKAFIVNPPSGFRLIWKALVTLGDFRREDVVVAQSGSPTMEMLMKHVGSRCLAREFGGSSPVSFGKNAAEEALDKLASAKTATLAESDDFRIDPGKDGHFPSAETLAEVRILDERQSTFIALYRKRLLHHLEKSRRDAGVENSELIFERRCILRDQIRLRRIIAEAQGHKGLADDALFSKYR